MSGGREEEGNMESSMIRNEGRGWKDREWVGAGGSVKDEGREWKDRGVGWSGWKREG